MLVVLMPKTFINKAEGDVIPHVMPQSRCVLTLIVASDGKAFLDKFVPKDAGLWELVHTLANFNIYPSIGANNFVEIVFVGDFLGNDIQPWAHVVIVFHWGVHIEIGKVDAVERCPRSRDNGDEKEFSCGEISSGRALVPRVVNAIVTHGKPSPAWFVLLRTIIVNNTSICIRASFLNI